MTLDEALSRYRRRPHDSVRGSTLALWRAAEARWAARWGNQRLSRLKPHDIDAYFRALQDRGWVPSSLRREACYLRRFIRWCQAHSYVASDPTRALPRFAGGPRRRRVALGREELAQLLEACRAPYIVPTHASSGRRTGTWYQRRTPPEWLYPLVLAAARTLMRLGDLLDLRWGELDLRASRITREQRKTHRPITIPIAADLAAWLTSQEPQAPSDPVFQAPDRVAVWRAFKAAVARAKIQSCTFHDLRASGATWLLEQGVPIHLVQAMGGWARPDVLIRIYAQVHQEPLDEVARLLARFGA